MVTRKLLLVLGVTAGFVLVEVIGGYLSGSLALLADAGHMATDVAALALATFGAHIAQRKAPPSQRFGNLRWEVLAAMVNGLALFVMGGMITVEAFHRLREPNEVNALLFGAVALAGLAVNLFALKTLHGHHHHDLNVRGAYLHIMGDVLGSIGAVGAAVLIHFTGWVAADPLISAVISLLILRSAWRLVRESGTILLDRTPPHVAIPAVEAALLKHPEVDRVHDVHVWTVTSGYVAMSAHVVVPELATHPEVLRRLEHEMTHLGIGHVTIQLETGGDCHGEHCGEGAHPREAAVAHVHGVTGAH